MADILSELNGIIYKEAWEADYEEVCNLFMELMEGNFYH